MRLPLLAAANGGQEHTALKTLRDFEVWIDPVEGSRGTDVVTIGLDGATDEGEYWELGGVAANGVTADGWTGEATCDFDTNMTTATNPATTGFLIVDMSSSTAGSTNRGIFSSKVSTGATAAGLHVMDPTADQMAPSTRFGDGAASFNLAVHGTNLMGAGRCAVFFGAYWFVANAAWTQVVTSAGAGTQITDTGGGTAIDTFEFPQNGMVFGALCDSATTGPGGGPNPADGPDGVSSFKIYGAGFTRHSTLTLTTPQMLDISRFYGVL